MMAFKAQASQCVGLQRAVLPVFDLAVGVSPCRTLLRRRQRALKHRAPALRSGACGGGGKRPGCGCAWSQTASYCRSTTPRRRPPCRRRPPLRRLRMAGSVRPRSFALSSTTCACSSTPCWPRRLQPLRRQRLQRQDLHPRLLRLQRRDLRLRLLWLQRRNHLRRRPLLLRLQRQDLRRRSLLLRLQRQVLRQHPRRRPLLLQLQRQDQRLLRLGLQPLTPSG